MRRPRLTTPHLLVIGAASVAWVITIVLVVIDPTLSSRWRLAFTVTQDIATIATMIAVLPWVLHDFLADVVRAYLIGYANGEQDANEAGPPRLQVVPDLDAVDDG